MGWALTWKIHFKLFLISCGILVLSGCLWSPEESKSVEQEGKKVSKFGIIKTGYRFEESISVDESKFQKLKELGLINSEDQYHPGAWSTVESISRVELKVCLKSRASGSKIINQKFRIDFLEHHKKEVLQSSDDEGCIYWGEEFPINFFADATYIIIKRKIVGIGANSGSLIASFAINPWAIRDKSKNDVISLDTSAFDENQYPVAKTKDEIISALQGNGQEKKRLILSDFNYRAVKKGTDCTEIENKSEADQAKRTKAKCEYESVCGGVDFLPKTLQGISCANFEKVKVDGAKNCAARKEKLMTSVASWEAARYCTKKQSQEVDFHIENLKPSVSVKNINGKDVFYQLKSGEYFLGLRVFSERSGNDSDEYNVIDENLYDLEKDSPSAKMEHLFLLPDSRFKSTINKMQGRYAQAQIISDEDSLKTSFTRILPAEFGGLRLGLALLVKPAHPELSESLWFYSGGSFDNRFKKNKAERIQQEIAITRYVKSRNKKLKNCEVVNSQVGDEEKSLRETCRFNNEAKADEDYENAKLTLFPDIVQKEKNRIINIKAGRQATSFKIDYMTPRFIRIVGGESSTSRGVGYRVTMGISLPGGGSIDGTPFRIIIKNTITDKIQKKIVTADGNKVSWTGNLWHKPFAPEKYFRFKVMFEELDRLEHKMASKRGVLNPDAKFKVVSTTCDFKYGTGDCGYYINPWDEKWTFGLDQRQMDLEQQIKNEMPKIRSRFFVPDYGYHTLRFRYDVDENLNLNVKKTVLLKLSPRMLRYSSQVQGRLATYALRDGIYLMKAALEKSYLDPAQKGVVVPLRQGWCFADDETAHQNEKVGAQLLTTEKSTGSEYLGDIENQAHKIVENLKLKRSSKVERCDRAKETFFDKILNNSYELNFKTKKHISVAKKLVRVINNQIITPLEFEVKDLRMMRVRANMLIQLELVDEYRLLMVNLYNDFYEQQMMRHIEGGSGPLRVITRDEFEALDAEKVENIHKIISQMRTRMPKGSREVRSKDLITERKVHDFIETQRKKLRTQKAVVKKTEEDGQYEFSRKYVKGMTLDTATERKVDYCVTSAEITWNDVFAEFGLNHPQLKSIVGDLVTVSDEKERYLKTQNLECVIPKNVLSQFYYNDFMSNKVRPIHNVDFNEFTDETSLVDPETFVGPVTFLLNGNGSNLRPTRNLQEQQCRLAPDCSQDLMNMENNLYKNAIAMHMDAYEKKISNGEFPNLARMNGLSDSEYAERVKDISLGAGAQEWMNQLLNVGKYDTKTFQNKDNTGYERSRYFNSIDHLNNKSVDEIIEEYEAKKIKEKKRMKIERLNFNYLHAFNLKLVSINDAQPVKRFDYSLCPNGEDSFDLYEGGKTKKSFKHCVSELDTGSNGETSYSIPFSRFLGVEESREDKKLLTEGYREMLRSADGQVSKKVAEHICEHFSKRYVDILSSDLEYYDHYRASVSRRTRRIMSARQKRDKDRFYKTCLTQIQLGKQNGVLSFSQRLIVNDTGKYFFKGGKSMNINLGSSYNYGYSESFSNSIGMSAGVSAPDVKGIPFVDMPKISAGFSRSWSNSISDSISISKGTFLVMQDAVLDILLSNYRQCMVVGFGEFHETLDKRVQKLLKNILNSTDSFYKQQLKKVSDDASPTLLSKIKDKSYGVIRNNLSGLMICDDEDETEERFVREHYYYFTQHFTEGDMLDPADIFNHPWLLMLRGKADMWRFLDRIEGRKIDEDVLDNQLNKGIFVSGNVKENTHTWPIDRLVDTYGGVLPSFPGVFTLNHSRFAYARDYPWNAKTECSSVMGQLGDYDKKFKLFAKELENLGAQTDALISESEEVKELSSGYQKKYIKTQRDKLISLVFETSNMIARNRNSQESCTEMVNGQDLDDAIDYLRNINKRLVEASSSELLTEVRSKLDIETEINDVAKQLEKLPQLRSCKRKTSLNYETFAQAGNQQGLISYALYGILNNQQSPEAASRGDMVEFDCQVYDELNSTSDGFKVLTNKQGENAPITNSIGSPRGRALEDK